jgi:hypothetical protein
LSGKYLKSTLFFDAYISDFHTLLAEGHSDFIAMTYTKALFEILLNRYGFPLDATWPRSFWTIYLGWPMRCFVLLFGKSYGNNGDASVIPQGALLQRCLTLSQPPSIVTHYFSYALNRLRKGIVKRTNSLRQVHGKDN